MKKSGIMKRTSRTTLESDPRCLQPPKKGLNSGTTGNYGGNIIELSSRFFSSMCYLIVCLIAIKISEMIVIYVVLHTHITQKVGRCGIRIYRRYTTFDSPWYAQELRHDGVNWYTSIPYCGGVKPATRVKWYSMVISCIYEPNNMGLSTNFV